MNLNSIKAGFLLNAAASFSLKVVSVIIAIYIARYYGADSYAHYSIVTNAFVVLAISMANPLSQLISASFIQNQVGFVDNIALAIQSIVFIIIFSVVGSNIYIYYNKSLAIGALELACITFFILISAAIVGFLNGSRKYKEYTFSALLSIAITLLFVIFSHHYNVVTDKRYYIFYAMPYFLQALIITVVYFKKVSQQFFIASPNLKLPSVARFINFGNQCLQLYGAALAAPLSLSFAYFYLSDGGNGKIQIAIYASCIQWVFILSQISVVSNNVLVSRIKNNRGISQLERLNFYLAWLAVLLLSLPLLYFPEIHLIVFGKEFSRDLVGLTLNIVIFTNVFNSFKSSIQREVIASQKAWISIASTAVWLSITIIALSWFHVSSAFGVAIVFFMASVISFAFFIPVFIKHKVMFVENYKTKEFAFYAIFSIFSFLASLVTLGVIERAVIFSLFLFVLLVSINIFFKKGRRDEVW